jgi:hypothetical protein
VADELTFTDVVDRMADLEGQQTYIEIGTKDREAEQPGDAFVLKLHGMTFSKVKDATDESGERRAPMVTLGDDSRLFINPRQVTKIEGNRGGLVKVWLDEAFYIAFGG